MIFGPIPDDLWRLHRFKTEFLFYSFNFTTGGKKWASRKCLNMGIQGGYTCDFLFDILLLFPATIAARSAGVLSELECLVKGLIKLFCLFWAQI